MNYQSLFDSRTLQSMLESGIRTSYYDEAKRRKGSKVHVASALHLCQIGLFLLARQRPPGSLFALLTLLL